MDKLPYPVTQLSFGIACLLMLAMAAPTCAQENQNITTDGLLQTSIFTLPHFNTADTAAIRTLFRKGKALEKSAPDSALSYYMQAYKMSRSGQYATGMTYSLLHIGHILYAQSKFEQASFYYQNALIYAKLSDSLKSVILDIYGNLANIHFFLGAHSKAAQYYDTLLKEALSDPDQYGNQIIKSYNNMSAIYRQLKQYDLALYYYTRAENECKKQNDWTSIVQSLVGKGDTYILMSKPELAKQTYEEALRISETYNDKTNLWFATLKMGDPAIHEHDPQQAVYYLKKVAAMDASHIHPKHYLSFIPYYLGVAYFQLKNYPKAEYYLSACLEQCKKTGYINDIYVVHEKLSSIYAITGKYRQAWELQQIAQRMKDSILTKEKSRDINELEIKYRTAEKDRELAIRDKELAVQHLNIARAEAASRKKTAWIWISSLSALLLAVSIVLLRYRQISRERHIQQLRELELLRATMEGEETERVRVGKELHDGVSGFLSAIKINLVSLRMQRKEIAADAPYINALSLADEAADELRKTAHNLVPTNLVRKGLSEAITGFCERLSHPNGMQLDVEITGNPIRLDAEKELAVYRIIQELVHNIIKHSGASKVIITISWLEEVLMITIEDNGVGMPVQTSSNGIGMENIHKRIQSINGSLEIENNEDGGTSMYLYFPL